MIELNPKEQDLLERVKANKDLEPLFFRRVKGLKWFAALESAGYFAPAHVPQPIPTDPAGYFTIRRWAIAEYLTKTAPELAIAGNERYAEAFVEVIAKATAFAKERGFGNYQTWWQFAEALTKIPSHLVPVSCIDVIDYWLDDKFDRSLVVSEVGERWLPRLLEEGQEHSLALSERLIQLLFRVKVIDEVRANKTVAKATLRFDHYHAERIVKACAHLAGKRLESRAYVTLANALTEAVTAEDNDSWSYIWQPAIEEHDQNEHRNDASNILVYALRDCVSGILETEPTVGQGLVEGLLRDERQIKKRLGIYFVSRYSNLLAPIASQLIATQYLSGEYRHEYWHFLHRCYSHLDESQRNELLSLIGRLRRDDDSGQPLAEATAYQQATWYAAVRDFGPQEEALYRSAVGIVGSEPDHPDFSSYMSIGWTSQKSLYSAEELSGTSVDDLVTILREVPDAKAWDEPGIEGMARTLKDVLKSSPLRYYRSLWKFEELALPYVHSVLQAYSELWGEKATLPWADVWEQLLAFCVSITHTELFWGQSNATESHFLTANHDWIVSSIARLVDAGVRSDEHAVAPQFNQRIEHLLSHLLEHQQGRAFKTFSDAMTTSINSPRGNCIEALINLTLRECRLADKEAGGQHLQVWRKYEPYFEREFSRMADGNYEFATLIANYLPNAIYITREWALGSLPRIFPMQSYEHWLCAMQGYAYTRYVYPEVYEYLKTSGSFSKALDDEILREEVCEKVIQNVVIAYLNDDESLDGDGSLIRFLIERRNLNEMNRMIWFIWTMRNREDTSLSHKVFALWHAISEVIDVSTDSGRKLASSLCRWSVYIENLDAESFALLKQIAPFADVEHNSAEVLKCLAEVSRGQPLEANSIWKEILRATRPEYPEEAIQEILANLVSYGADGVRGARESVSEYLKYGSDKPDRWLGDLLRRAGRP